VQFEAGQKFISVRDPTISAEVVQARHDGHVAWLQIRALNGELLDKGQVNSAQIAGHWMLLAPGYGEPIERADHRIWVIADEGLFQACTARIDRRPIRAGASLGPIAFTHHYEKPEHALAAAESAIASREVE